MSGEIEQPKTVETTDGVNDLLADPETFIPLLLDLFPKIKPDYKELKDYWERDPDIAPVIDDVLNPYMIRIIQEGDDTEIEALFDFFERMASSSDYRVRKLLSIGICESLAASPEVYRYASFYIKPETQAEYERLVAE